MEQSGNSKTLSERRFSKAEHWASANADGQHSRRCTTASPPSGDGPPMGQKTVLRPNNPLSAEHTDPLAGGCAERAPVPDRECGVTANPEADTGPRPRAGTKWKPKNHFQEGVSKTRSRAGRTPMAGAAAGAPLPAAPDRMAHQWAEKPHFDPKNT